MAQNVVLFDTVTGKFKNSGSPLGGSAGYFVSSVRAVATSNITLSGTQTIDGVSLIANDRAGVFGQTTVANNGIYIVSAGAWTRATDLDLNTEFLRGLGVAAEESGTLHGNSVWVLQAAVATLGSDPVTFKRVSGKPLDQDFDVGSPTTQFVVTVGTVTTLGKIDVWRNGALVREGPSYDYQRNTGANRIDFNSSVTQNAWVRVRLY